MTVQFVPGTYFTTEGGQVAMMLQLSGAVDRAVTVNFATTDGTATGKCSGTACSIVATIRNEILSFIEG